MSTETKKGKNVSITKNEATKLWGQLRNALLGLEDLLAEIVEKKAWEPLGYRTFHEAWAKELKDVKLSEIMQAKVIYAMFASGATTTDVASAIDGVGPVTAKAYEKAYDKELAPELAPQAVRAMEPQLRALRDGETLVHTHIRRKPQFTGKITGEGFTEDEVKTWKSLADKNGLDWKETVSEALRNGLNQKLGIA